MAWTAVFLDARVEDAMLGQPAGIRARFDHVKQLIAEHGPMQLPPKYVKHIDGQL